MNNKLKEEINQLIIKYNITQPELYAEYSNKRPLIIHCCHHKTGTVVIEKILRAVCIKFGIKYQYCSQDKLEETTDVWVEHHSKIDFSKINRPIIGTHMIRNPCAIIISAFEYHKKTIEPWANKKIPSYENKSYRSILNSLSKENGIIFEMKNKLYVESSRNTIMDIYYWDYFMPNFLELKYEDLMIDFNGVLKNMFKHYGFTREMIVIALEIAKPHNLRNKTENDLKKNGHITNKDIDLYKWKEYFLSDVIISKFLKTYPDNLFDKIGYSLDKITSKQPILNNSTILAE
jgi:hypothetical protein